MPLDDQKLGGTSDIPTKQEIESQLEILCAQPSLKGDKRDHLLRFLVKQKMESLFPEHPRQRKRVATGKQNIYGFYKYWSALTRQKPPGDEDDSEIAGKKLVNSLAVRLEQYYERVSDRVVILIPPGRGTGYLPVIAYCGDHRLQAARRASPAKVLDSNNPAQPIGNLVACHFMGNDREAMKYVLERYRSGNPLPRLIGLRDTHVRAEVPMRYREDYYSQLQAEFAAFLSDGDPDITKCTLIFGWEVDNAYARMVQSAATGQGDKLKCYRLRNRGPLMNFILMDYEDLTSEVLFGWGLGRPGWPGAVFRSGDERLVEEFSSFYDVLLQTSDRISVESLLEKPLRNERGATPHQVP